MAKLWHLTKRFFGSLSSAAPDSRDEAWALRNLNSGEADLWRALPNADKRHALGVALDVAGELGPETPREVIAAALLHDVGKLVSGLGTPSRVVATVLWAIRDEDKALLWVEREGFRGRLARYRLHPDFGADLLTKAGSHEITIAWAQEHHLPPDLTQLPARYADVLRRYDND